MSTVLVSGGSGFLGSLVIVQLLRSGHVVRTTLRSLGREQSVRAMVRQGIERAGVERQGLELDEQESSVQDAADRRLSFFAVDLERSDGGFG